MIPTTISLEPGFQQQSPPRLRLAIALLIATVAHAFLLIFVRIDLLEPGARNARLELEITLLAEEQAIKQDAATIHKEDDDPPEPLIAPVPTITTPPEQPESKRPMMGSAGQPNLAIDWQQLAEKAAQDVVAEEEVQESHRAEMWRRTHSVMFAPPPDYLIADEPYLPVLPFNDRSFKGIGFKIGKSCYFGILAGMAEEVDSDASDSSTVGMRRTGSNLVHCNF